MQIFNELNVLKLWAWVEINVKPFNETALVKNNMVVLTSYFPARLFSASTLRREDVKGPLQQYFGERRAR